MNKKVKKILTSVVVGLSIGSIGGSVAVYFVNNAAIDNHKDRIDQNGGGTIKIPETTTIKSFASKRESKLDVDVVVEDLKEQQKQIKLLKPYSTDNRNFNNAMTNIEDYVIGNLAKYTSKFSTVRAREEFKKYKLQSLKTVSNLKIFFKQLDEVNDSFTKDKTKADRLEKMLDQTSLIVDLVLANEVTNFVETVKQDKPWVTQVAKRSTDDLNESIFKLGKFDPNNKYLKTLISLRLKKEGKNTFGTSKSDKITTKEYNKRINAIRPLFIKSIPKIAEIVKLQEDADSTIKELEKHYRFSAWPHIKTLKFFSNKIKELVLDQLQVELFLEGIKFFFSEENLKTALREAKTELELLKTEQKADRKLKVYSNSPSTILTRKQKSSKYAGVFYNQFEAISKTEAEILRTRDWFAKKINEVFNKIDNSEKFKIARRTLLTGGINLDALRSYIENKYSRFINNLDNNPNTLQNLLSGSLITFTNYGVSAELDPTYLIEAKNKLNTLQFQLKITDEVKSQLFIQESNKLITAYEDFTVSFQMQNFVQNKKFFKNTYPDLMKTLTDLKANRKLLLENPSSAKTIDSKINTYQITSKLEEAKKLTKRFVEERGKVIDKINEYVSLFKEVIEYRPSKPKLKEFAIYSMSNLLYTQVYADLTPEEMMRQVENKATSIMQLNEELGLARNLQKSIPSLVKSLEEHYTYTFQPFLIPLKKYAEELNEIFSSSENIKAFTKGTKFFTNTHIIQRMVGEAQAELGEILKSGRKTTDPITNTDLERSLKYIAKESQFLNTKINNLKENYKGDFGRDYPELEKLLQHGVGQESYNDLMRRVLNKNYTYFDALKAYINNITGNRFKGSLYETENENYEKVFQSDWQRFERMVDEINFIHKYKGSDQQAIIDFKLKLQTTVKRLRNVEWAFKEERKRNPVKAARYISEMKTLSAKLKYLDALSRDGIAIVKAALYDESEFNHYTIQKQIEEVVSGLQLRV